MALKNVCIIPHSWSPEDYSRHTCQDNSHAHFSRAQLRPYENHGVVEWIRESQTRREKSIVKIHCGQFRRGLSCIVGGVLATAVRERQPWAQVMLATIRGKKTTEDETAQSPAAAAGQLAGAFAVRTATISMPAAP